MEDQLIKEGYTLHHTAWKVGYVSRVKGAYKVSYTGRYGKGIVVHYPCYISTRFHIIAYYIK